MSKRPILLNFDIEPEEFQTNRDAPDDWRGFEALVEILQDFRGRCRAATKNRVHFNWYVRLDPQVEITYGSADWPFRRYERLFQILEKEGDEIGLHTHTWRWHEERQRWVAEFADQAWVEHCVRLSFETYRECFGRPCQSFRFGTGWLNNATVELLERLGIRRDLTIEPGQPAGPAPSFGIGFMPDLTVAPQYPYRPARDQFTRPGRWWNRRRLWMIPASTVDIHALLGPVRVDRTQPARSDVRVEGYLDGVDTREIFGWAYDLDRPNEAIAVDLFLDGQPWTSLWAEEPRLDLVEAGKGNGRHAFRVSVPAELRDDRSHVIRAQFAGRAQQLVGSPRTVAWPINAPPTFHALDLCLRASYLRPWLGHLLAAGTPYLSMTARTAVGVAEDREDALLATLQSLLELAQVEQFSFDTSAEALHRLKLLRHQPRFLRKGRRAAG